MAIRGRDGSCRPRSGEVELALCLVERFGPMAFGLAVVEKDGTLGLAVRRRDILGAPMPAFLAPFGNVYESAEDGRFRFHVEINLPVVGLVVRYRGWLAPKSV